MTSSGQLTIWMRLRGAQAFIAQTKAASASVLGMGSSVDRLARHMDRAGRRTWVMNQALFTLRRYAYMSTLALTAGIAVVAKWGFDYNSQVQEASLAFKKFGMTHKEVNAEVRELYRLAAISPFLFTDITRATRRFMAFGMSASMANETITRLSDALVTLGVPTGAAMQRASLALAHLMSIGRLTGQVVYQLSRDNVPIVKALETELGLTADQMRRIGSLGIPATVAIQALNKYIKETPRFQNASLLFATKTWRGIITTSRDYMAQFMGAIEKPLFNKLQAKALVFLKWLTNKRVNNLAASGDITGVIGTFSPGLARVWSLISRDLRAVWNILVNGLIPAFVTMARVVGPILLVQLWIISRVLKFIGDHAFLAKVFFMFFAAAAAILTARYLILLPIQATLMAMDLAWNAVRRIGIALTLIRIATVDTETGAEILNTEAKTKNIIATGWLGRKILSTTIGTRLATAATRLYTAATVGSIRASNGQFVKLTRLEIVVMKMRRTMILLKDSVIVYTRAVWGAVAAQLAAWASNPIFWAIAVIAVLAILYWKWKAFHDVVNATIRFLWHNPIAAFFIPVLGPLIQMIKLLTEAYHLVKRVWRFFSGGSGPVASAHSYGRGANLRGVHGMAAGGDVTRSGMFMVGENGPELAYLNRGEAVRPLGREPAIAGSIGNGGLFEFTFHNIMEVDGKKMAESVSKHRLDGAARR